MSNTPGHDAPGTHAPGSHTPGSNTSVSAPIRILVVDSDPLAAQTAASLLAGETCTLDAVGSAAAAIQFMQVHGTDIVLLDRTLADMDGLEFCRQIRSRHDLGNTYILLVTGSNEQDCTPEAFKAGADDFVSKPFHHAELRARVRAASRIITLQRRLAASILIAQRTTLEQSLLNGPLGSGAATDVLTGLSSTTHVLSSLPLMADLSHRVQMPLACLVLDLDDFKAINDAQGQAAGDDVIRAVGQRIKHSARAADLVAHTGADKFLLLSVVRDAPEAHALAERLRQVVCTQPITTDMGLNNVTASVGVACMGGEMHDPEALLREAETALRNAKAAGRNAVSPAGTVSIFASV